jgi:hypothetical protein
VSLEISDKTVVTLRTSSGAPNAFVERGERGIQFVVAGTKSGVVTAEDARALGQWLLETFLAPTEEPLADWERELLAHSSNPEPETPFAVGEVVELVKSDHRDAYGAWDADRYGEGARVEVVGGPDEDGDYKVRPEGTTETGVWGWDYAHSSELRGIKVGPTLAGGFKPGDKVEITSQGVTGNLQDPAHWLRVGAIGTVLEGATGHPWDSTTTLRVEADGTTLAVGLASLRAAGDGPVPPDPDREPAVGDTIEILTDGPDNGNEWALPATVGYHAFRKGSLAVLTALPSDDVDDLTDDRLGFQARGISADADHDFGEEITQYLGAEDFKLV